MKWDSVGAALIGIAVGIFAHGVRLGNFDAAAIGVLTTLGIILLKT